MGDGLKYDVLVKIKGNGFPVHQQFTGGLDRANDAGNSLRSNNHRIASLEAEADRDIRAVTHPLLKVLLDAGQYAIDVGTNDYTQPIWLAASLDLVSIAVGMVLFPFVWRD